MCDRVEKEREDKLEEEEEEEEGDSEGTSRQNVRSMGRGRASMTLRKSS